MTGRPPSREAPARSVAYVCVCGLRTLAVVAAADPAHVHAQVYEGLSYKLSVAFSEKYPYEPPTVKFVTPCFHPNVDTAGNICLDILKVRELPRLVTESVALCLAVCVTVCVAYRRTSGLLHSVCGRC